MNEPIFRNIYKRDIETIKEFSRYASFSPKFNKFGIIYFLVFLPILCALVFKNMGAILGLLVGILIGLVAIVTISVINYFRIIKHYVASDNEDYNGQDIIVYSTVYDNRIESEILGNYYTTYFKDIKHAEESTNYIYLVTNSKRKLALKKDSFTFGSYDQFVGFLANKGINIK